MLDTTEFSRSQVESAAAQVIVDEADGQDRPDG